MMEGAAAASGAAVGVAEVVAGAERVARARAEEEAATATMAAEVGKVKLLQKPSASQAARVAAGWRAVGERGRLCAEAWEGVKGSGAALSREEEARKTAWAWLAGWWGT